MAGDSLRRGGRARGHGRGTLDHEPFTGGYEVFTQGEFVFTTLGFAGVHPDLAEEALLALIECGVAAVAVKPWC